MRSWQLEETTKCRSKLVLQRLGLLCGGHAKVSGLPLWVSNWLSVEQELALLISPTNDSFGASRTALLGILYSSRLVLLYTGYLGDRQTVENYVVLFLYQYTTAILRPT